MMGNTCCNTLYSIPSKWPLPWSTAWSLNICAGAGSLCSLNLFVGCQTSSGATFYLFSWWTESTTCRSAVFVSIRRQQRGVLRSVETLRNARTWAPVYLSVRVRACAWFWKRACTCIYVGVFLWVCLRSVYACVCARACVCVCVCVCVRVFVMSLVCV